MGYNFDGRGVVYSHCLSDPEGVVYSREPLPRNGGVAFQHPMTLADRRRVLRLQQRLARCRKVYRYLQPHLPDDPARFHPIAKRPAGVHGHLVERLALECLGHGSGLPDDQ